ncbi:general odorant-binding protein 56h-like [Eupeodes corollae]|uniref:general odorant-binding protein 56h-like n=1 Tax=Eupeodes corollae TaxID=290404 RepID=UPI0024919149|nr:general odorant-binding protein 56h-like [Eupeodes corollae]
MKFILLVAIIVACIGGQVWACDNITATISAVEKCKEVQNITEEEMEHLLIGDFDDGGADENVMCFVKCVMDGFDALDGDELNKGAFNDFFEPILGPEKTEKLYDECKDESGDEECETAFKTAICLMKSENSLQF